MIRWNQLTDEDKKFVINCVLRLHKEKGCFNKFKKKFKSYNNILNSYGKDKVTSKLIELVWEIYGRENYHNEDDYLIIASLKYLDLIDILSSNKSRKIYCLCQEIACSEFNYINQEIADYSTITAKTKEKINSQWEKYNSFTEGSEFKNIPCK